MKRILKKLSLILVFAIIISGIQPSNVFAASKKYVKSLSVSKKKLTIRVGKKVSLSYKVKGKASKKITIKVSNSNVKVKVKKSKLYISAKKAGNSKITISTKAKNKKGKKIKKIIKVKTVKKNTAKTPKPSKSPTMSTPIVFPSDAGAEVTKSEWIFTVMNTTGYSIQKELFDYNEKGNITYSFTDIKDDQNADLIETAVKYGIIPNSGSKFNPNAAADREFLAVTSIRAIGFATDKLEINYDDKANLKYETEDAIAIQLELLKLSDNKFLPTKPITKVEKQKSQKILSDIVTDRKIDKNHVDIIEYSEDVVNEKKVTDYTISEKDGIYTLTTSIGTQMDKVTPGHKTVLPANDSYPEGIALIVTSNTISQNGKNRTITGMIPDNVAEFVDTVDIEGEAEADPNSITAVDGVATVKVIEEDKGSSAELKRANIDGDVNLKDKTKISFTIKEIETTISFYLSELKYRVDFNKKGVNDLYIGLPSVLSMDTDYKASKNFSKKIGDIPIKLAAGFSANFEVYLEASISGEISMNLRLSNNIGMHYYNGHFYVIKSCEPSFDMMVDADVDAGTKLQLGLYWMKGIKEAFGKSDSRPVYNVYTKWGIHGDTTIHIRNDQYTSYKNLTCIDLAYYLYGKISVGDDSFLGDKFNLKKVWVIFNDQNSPLKGEWHIENGKIVNDCTYKLPVDSILKNYAQRYNYLCHDTNTYDVYASYNQDASYGINTFDSIPVIPFSYDIYDYDGDGDAELLIANTGLYTIDYEDYNYSESYKAIFLEMYEFENGNVVKKAVSDYKFDGSYSSWYISPHDKQREGNTVIYRYQHDHTPIIALEQHSIANIFADGVEGIFRAYKYNGQNFESIGDTLYSGSDFDEDSLKRIKTEYQNMGIEVDVEQILNGQKKVYDYVNNLIIFGKSSTNMTVDWTINDTLRNNPSSLYKISNVNFSVN